MQFISVSPLSAARSRHGGGGAAASNATIPNLYPNDGTYGWVWAGTDLTTRSGQFQDGGGTPTFNSTTDVTNYAAGTGPNGIDAMRVDYPVMAFPGGGPGVYLNLAAPQRNLFIRWFYKQSNPYNWNGTQNNSDAEKLIRWEGGGLAYSVNVYICSPTSGGVPSSNWDQWDPSGHEYTAWNYGAHVGQWNCYEMQCDTTAGAGGLAHLRLWVNDVLMMDDSQTIGSGGLDMQNIQVTGVQNSMASASSAWWTMWGFSTQRMYCPPGYTFPA